MTAPDRAPSATPDPLAEQLRGLAKSRPVRDLSGIVGPMLAALDRIEGLTAENERLEETRAMHERDWQDAVRRWQAAEARLSRYEKALRGLSSGTAHPDDPMLKGDALCWCRPRGMFAQGPHDDECLTARAALDEPESPR